MMANGVPQRFILEMTKAAGRWMRKLG